MIPCLTIKNVSKEFYGVRVLDEVSMEVERGEIHGLIGENGAGKSTLMNIVSGMLDRNEGEVMVDGVPHLFGHPVEAEKEGIIHIHQELNILPELSIVENLFLGKEVHRYGILQTETMNQKARHIFSRLGQSLDVLMRAGDLPIGHQQIVEIAKSLLHHKVKLIILDEPTASLANHEIEKLFEIILYLKEQEQVSFIYVSHRMHELFHICERLTVLRDGKYVGTVQVEDTTLEEVVIMMIGRRIEEQYTTKVDSIDTERSPILQIRHISRNTRFKDISFDLQKGEILAFYGLVGAGRTDVIQAIFGVTPLEQGSISIEGKIYHKPNPSESIKKGIGFLSEDRKLEGVLSNVSIQSNVSISNFKEMSFLGVIEQKKEEDIVDRFIQQLSVKVSNIRNSIFTLSGGNQQKVLLARCFNYPLKVLLLDEPTRGIDVGSKHDIYEIMRELAIQGVGIIMVSSDLPEVLGVADRIAVMHEGNLVDIVPSEDADQEKIMYLSTNTHSI